MTQHKRKICSRCKQGDREFPYSLYGESGQLIRIKNNKIVCYHCWNMLKHGKGHYMGLDQNGKGYDSTDEIAFSSVKVTGWFDKKSKTPYGTEQQLDQDGKKQNNTKSDHSDHKMTLIDNIVRDLLVADPKMTATELVTHCLILGTHKGLTKHEIKEQLQTCEQYLAQKGDKN